MLTRVVLLSALLVLSSAFMEFMLPQPIPEKFKGQTGCYLPQEDIVIAYGSTIAGKDRCVEYRCGERGVSIAGCSAVLVEAPCILKEDKMKPYPDCCSKPFCP